MLNACGSGGDKDGEIQKEAASPAVPTGLAVIAVSSYRIDLSWDEAADDGEVSGYNVYRNGMYIMSVISAFASDTKFPRDVRHCYSVSAFDGEGNESALSEEECAGTDDNTSVAALVVQENTGELARIDVSTGTITVIQEGLEMPADVAVTSGGEHAYVTEYFSGSLTKVNTKTWDSVRLVSSMNSPLGLAISSDNQMIYVLAAKSSSREFPDSLYSINTRSLAVNMIADGLDNAFYIAIEPGDYSALITCYSLSEDINRLVRVDLHNGNMTEVADLSDEGVVIDVAVEPGKKSALVTMDNPAGLKRVDLESGQVRTLQILNTDFRTGYPFGIVLEPDGNHALITLYDRDELVRVSLKNGEITKVVHNNSGLVTPTGITLVR